MSSNKTKIERKSDREVVVSRVLSGSPRVLFDAWTKAELFARWWVPKSFPAKLLSCELDARVGGTYRLVFSFDSKEMAFFGRYLEVKPGARLVWTNDEGGEANAAITTVTFEQQGDQTLVTMSDLHPSKELLEASGSTDAAPEVWDQLEAFLVSRAA
jgi:uncharacterized protein YndB with AHSA1/START domain